MEEIEHNESPVQEDSNTESLEVTQSDDNSETVDSRTPEEILEDNGAEDIYDDLSQPLGFKILNEEEDEFGILAVDDRVFHSPDLKDYLKTLTRTEKCKELVLCKDGDHTAAGAVFTGEGIEEFYYDNVKIGKEKHARLNVGFYARLSGDQESQQERYFEQHEIKPEHTYNKENILELYDLMNNHENLHIYAYSMGSFGDELSDFLGEVFNSEQFFYTLKAGTRKFDHKLFHGIYGLQVKELYEALEDYKDWNHNLSVYAPRKTEGLQEGFDSSVDSKEDLTTFKEKVKRFIVTLSMD